MSLLVSLVLVAATLLGARRFGVRNVALPACLPMLLSFSGAFHWATGLAPAPLIGWLAAVQVERGRGYGQIIAFASLPGLVLGLLQAGGFLGEEGQREQVAAEVTGFIRGSGAEVQLGDPAMLQQLVENPMARALLGGEVADGATIVVDTDASGSVIVVDGSAAAAGTADPRDNDRVTQREGD